MKKVTLQIKYDDYNLDGSPLVLGTINVADETTPDSLRRRINDEWSNFSYSEPSSDSEFIDWLTERGWDVETIAPEIIELNG